MEEQNYRRELPGSRRVILDIKDLPFSAREALNVLRGNIQLSGFDLKVIAVTSAMANDGKSTVAFRLAKSFSALKKRTLYLDCDIRNSSTMARYDIREEVRGLSEFLCGEAVMNEIIYRTDDRYMDIIFTARLHRIRVNSFQASCLPCFWKKCGSGMTILSWIRRRSTRSSTER